MASPLSPAGAKTPIPANLVRSGEPSRRVLFALGWYDHSLHRGAARYASRHGWVFEFPSRHREAIPDHWDGDGVISLMNAANPKLTALVRASRAPVVDLALWEPSIPVPRVVPDSDQIGRLGVEHLSARGFHHLYFLVLENVWADQERSEAFIQHGRRMGLNPQVLDWPAARASRRLGRRDLEPWLAGELQRLPHPLAIMVSNDEFARFVLRASESAGLGIPEQIALLGVNNERLDCECLSVPLSSVDVNLEQMGYEAAALLHRLMRGETPCADVTRLPPKGVVTRQSTNILAVAHPHVAAALKHIWDHYHEPITAHDVTQAVPMSRSGLLRAFREHLGRSPADELLRVRVEEAKRRLAADEKVAAVAQACGFSNIETFSRAFHRRTGMTASAYRAKHRDTP